jgi:hypothetical protein
VQVLGACDTEEGVGGGKVASLDRTRLVRLLLKLERDLEQWEDGSFTGLLVHLRQHYGIGKVLITILALEESAGRRSALMEYILSGSLVCSNAASGSALRAG